MSASITKMIKSECAKYMDAMDTPEESRKKLEMLAVQSYYNMPKNKRKDWTLEQIITQGL